MCSIGDADNEGATIMEQVDELNLDGNWCRKCTEKTPAKVVLRKKDAYCRECLLASVTHKFRACLGKSRAMRPRDRVLVGFSGSSGSAALLHLVHCGLSDTSHKRLMVEPQVLYIDESEVLSATIEEQEEINKNIMQALEQYSFPKHMLPLRMCLETEDALEAVLSGHVKTADNNGTTTIKQLFMNLSDVSSRVDLLCKLRHNLLVQAAKALKCSKVFTAESADDLAVKLFTNVSLGRGAQLPFDVGFSDNRDSDVNVIRPLRDISKKELAFYSIFQGLESVHISSLTTKTDSHSSIQRLTETFLRELQDGFPSTLSTVFRVADKLTTPAVDSPTCPLCQAPADVASSSFTATDFSGLLSSLGPSNFDAFTLEKLTENSSDSITCGEKTDQDGNCCGRGTCGRSTSLDMDMQAMMCYGCRLILKNTGGAKLSPEFIRHLQESKQRIKMKKEIEDFLL